MNRTFGPVLALIAIAFASTLARAQTADNFFGNKTTDAEPAVSGTTNGLKIISAVWGSGANFVDVTDKVSQILTKPDTTFTANLDWLKQDPTPRWKKSLVTVFESDGGRYVLGINEDSDISVQILKDCAEEQKNKK